MGIFRELMILCETGTQEGDTVDKNPWETYWILLKSRRQKKLQWPTLGCQEKAEIKYSSNYE